MVRELEERHRHSYRNDGRSFLDGYGGDVNPVVLQPTAADPKLFIVRCTVRATATFLSVQTRAHASARSPAASAPWPCS